MTLTPLQIYQLAINAGFPPNEAVTAVAVALKESSGDPNAHNTTPPDDSYGLWQINMYGNLAAARIAQFGLTSATDLFDPQTNANAAFAIWGGNDANWQIAWAIQDGGSNQARFNSFLPAAQNAAQQYAQLQNSPGMPTGGGGTTATGSPPSFYSGPSDQQPEPGWPVQPADSPGQDS